MRKTANGKIVRFIALLWIESRYELEFMTFSVATTALIVEVVAAAWMDRISKIYLRWNPG